MADEYDWRLLHDKSHLKNMECNPTDGEEISIYAPYLKRCEFCLKPVTQSQSQRWFLPTDLSFCICEGCYLDFKEMFGWRELDGWDIDWDKKE